MTRKSSTYEVVIIGAGAAGLAAAAVLGRSLRSVAVFGLSDRGNAGATEVHNLPYAEGIGPDELYVRMEQELAKHSIPIFREVVDQVSADNETGTVTVQTSGRRVAASRLLLANGVEYVIPPWVPEGTWGTTVFDCPFCHAYEHRGHDFVVVGPHPMTLDIALLCAAQARSLSVVLTDETATTGRAADRIRQLGGDVVNDTIEAAELGGPGQLDLTTSSGRRLTAAAVVLSGIARMRQAFVKQLQLKADRFGIPETDFNGRASNPLVWVAGNAAQPQYVMAEAMGSGIRCAISVHKNLAVESW